MALFFFFSEALCYLHCVLNVTHHNNTLVFYIYITSVNNRRTYNNITYVQERLVNCVVWLRFGGGGGGRFFTKHIPPAAVGSTPISAPKFSYKLSPAP